MWANRVGVFMRIVMVSWVMLLVCSFVVVSTDEAGATQQSDARIVDEAQKIAAAYHGLGWFNGTILVAKAGVPIHTQGYGLANRESSTANTHETKYNLGSIMKHYTAALVLQQVEKGALTLDDTLGQHGFAFADEAANTITIEQLLNHRSGFADIFTAEYRENQLAFDTIEKRLELLKSETLLFMPGSKRRYSNYGYNVLGAVLQKVTGKKFNQLLHSEIFDRLGLKNSVYPYSSETTAQSLRYSFNYAGEQQFVGVTEHHGPDGGIEATATDVLAFYRSLFYSDEILSPKKEALRQYFAVDGKHWGAYGGGAGVSAAVELDLENDYQIVVLSNSDNLVAELISGRIYSFIAKGTYDAVVLPPHVYAYKQYQKLGAAVFRAEFKARYEADGYTQFIGRTLNELGMSLLSDKKWPDALQVFETLAHLFAQAPQVYDSLAFAYQSMGNMDEAIRQFQKARALKADFKSDYSADNYGIVP